MHINSSLRDRIGAVVPLFTKVSALLISKFGRPMWYPSKQSIDQQYYVSAINPDAHRLLLSSGITTRPPTDGSRLSLWSRGMPRKEVEALWSIIGFATNGPISPSAKDFKHSQSLLSAMMYYNRGTLSKVNANDANQLPPSKDHLDRCSKEISWICNLISSKSFGTLPPNDMDKFVMNIIHKAVMLEASIVSLNTLPTVANGIVDDVVIKLWKSSSCDVGFVDSDAISHPNVLDSIFVSSGPNEAWNLTPSTRLLQRCVTLIATYASMIISKKVRWKGFSKLLSSTVAGFEKKAEEFELKPEGSKNENSVSDAFARNFSEDTSTRNSEIVSDGSAFFREIACYLLLGCVMARRNVTVSGVGIALDKRLREQVRLALIFLTSVFILNCSKAISNASSSPFHVVALAANLS